MSELKSGRTQEICVWKVQNTSWHATKQLAKWHGKKSDVLSDVEEKAVVEHLATLDDWGFPMDKTDLRIFVKSYLDKEGRQVTQFTNNYPGEDWSSSFVKRHRVADQQTLSEYKR